MAVTNKPIGGLLVGAAAVAAAAFGIVHLLGGDAEAPASDTVAAAQGPSTSDPEAFLEEQIAQLEENRAELILQQATELEELRATLTLPPGTSLMEPDTFPEITSQISERLSLLDAGAVQDDVAALPEPSLYAYEDDAFASGWAYDWQCAWLSTAVAQVEAGEEPSEAVQTLRSFTETPYIQYFPDYDSFLSQKVEPLLAGSFHPAKEFLNTCTPESLVD